MTAQNLFGDLALDATVQTQTTVIQELRNINDTLAVLLSAMLEKMPRVTGNDQAAVSIESGSVGIASNQTLGTVSNVSNVRNITGVGAKFVPGENLGMAGCQYIYDNIKVT